MDAVLGWLTRSDLIDPETALVDSTVAGTWWARPPEDPGCDDPAHGERWGTAWTIRAQVLYQLLTGRGTCAPTTTTARCRCRARGARVVGRLDLEAAALCCPLHLDACFLDCQEPVTLRQATAPAEGLYIAGGGFWWPKEVIGQLNLGFARATVWDDNARGRAIPTMLRGFRYDALNPGPALHSSSDQITTNERIAWLGQDPTGYWLQPYAHLVAIYRTEGHDRYARTVLIASQNRRRRRWGVAQQLAGPATGCCEGPSAMVIVLGSPCCGCWRSSPSAH